MDRLIKDAAKLDKTFKYNTKTVTKNKKQVQELDYTYADVVNAIHIVQTNMDITGTTAKEAGETISGSLGMMKSAWQNLVTGMGEGNEKKLDKLVNRLVDSGKTLLKNLMPVAENAIYGILHLIEASFPVFIQEIPPIITRMLPKVVQAVSALVVGIAQALPSMAGAIIQQLPYIWEQIRNSIRNDLIPMIGEAIGGLAGGDGKFTKLLTGNMQKFFKLVIGIVSDIAAKLTEFWTVVVQPIAEDLIHLILGRIVPALLNFYRETIAPLWDVISPKLSEFFAWIAGFWDGTLYPILTGAVGFMKNELFPVISDAIQWIIDNIDTILPIVGGVIAGIAAFSIISKVQGIIDIVSKLFGVITAHPFAIIIGVIGALVGYLVHLYNTNEDARDKINAAFDAIKGFWENTLKKAFEAIYKYVVEDLVPDVIEAWNSLKDAVKTVFDAVKGFWDNNLKKVFEAIYSYVVVTLIPKVIEGWNNVKSTFETVCNNIKGFWEKYLKKTFEAVRDFVVRSLIPKFKEFGDYVGGKFHDAFVKIKDYWKTELEPRITALKNALKTFYDTVIVPIAEYVGGAFHDAWKQITDFFNGPASDAVNHIYKYDLIPFTDWLTGAFSDAWDTVTGVLNGFIDFLTGAFSGNWERAWDGLVDMLGSIFGGISKLLKAPINSVIDMMNWMIGKVENAINKVVDGINKHVRIHLDPIDVPVVGRVFGGLDWGANLKRVNWGRIQKLMWKGGVLGEGEEALVGEYAPERLKVVNGHAIVAPISKSAGRLGGDTITNTINVYAQPGQDVEAIARAVQQQMTIWERQRKAAYV